MYTLISGRNTNIKVIQLGIRMAYWPSSCETVVSTGLTLCIVHMILINETGALCDTGVLFRFTFRSKYRDPMRIMAFFLFLVLRYAIINVDIHTCSIYGFAELREEVRRRRGRPRLRWEDCVKRDVRKA